MCLNFAAKLQIKTENRIKLLGNFIKKKNVGDFRER